MSAEFPPLTSTVQPSVSALLAVLPNGEAVRAALVRSVTIEEICGLIGQEETRYRVVVDLDDGTRRIVASDLCASDATDVARRTGRQINDILRTS